MARKAVERNIAYDDQRKLYYVSMELGRDENGKRIKQYRTFPTLAAARNGLRDFHAGLERERELERKLAPTQELDLSHWLEYWMDSIVRPNRAETTVYAYQKIIDNHIDPALGTVPLKRLTPKMVQEYYTETQRANGLSSNTMRRHHDLLSSALRSAVRQDVIPASPMERVEPPRVRTTESYFYNNQELKLLYQKIEGNILELAVKLAGSLGMRREEICGLKWENVDLQRHLVLIREARTAYGATIVQKETKNRSSVRTLYLPDEVYLLLEQEQARQQQERCLQSPTYNPTDHVILDAKGVPYSPNALSLAFTRFVKKNDLPRLTFHGLRHTFATIASCQGASLFDIGKALGHSTPATTGRIYTHLVDRTHEELVQRVSDALK
ncbi:MAG: site-specific integrase [Oscillospiraceae bacterium]|nr:site-specific integrase [Oscillospiraceae bacterium]